MQTVTVQISDRDYADLMAFFARPDAAQVGRPVVAVVAVLASERAVLAHVGAVVGGVHTLVGTDNGQAVFENHRGVEMRVFVRAGARAAGGRRGGSL